MSKDIVANKVDITPFEDKVEDKSLLMTLPEPEILQVNIGSKCNLACKHCHVEAGPHRTELMSRETMQAVLDVFRKGSFTTLDITGGAPEMNPDLEWFIREGAEIGHVIVRSNLVILDDPEYAHFLDVYKECGIEIFASLPYYTKKQMEKQRGTDTFDKAIKILQKLNEMGYGKEGTGLVLNLVYNPLGAFLPPVQSQIEPVYKQKLMKEFGIEFNNLFTITNNPCGRFGIFLENSGNLDGYMHRLYDAFNPATVANMMCRNQISVSYDGRVFDCDFNQALDLPIEGGKTIFDFVSEPAGVRRIAVANHCYACCAGAGSSCGGNTAE